MRFINNRILSTIIFFILMHERDFKYFVPSTNKLNGFIRMMKVNGIKFCV